MTRSEHGAELKRSYNCCQAVLLAYADLLPLSEAQLLALGSTFGSGMGGVKGTCGALCGAEMVLGLLAYRGANMNSRSRAVFGAFEDRCRATICCDIKGFITGRTLCSCEDCVKNAIEIVEEALAEN